MAKKKKTTKVQNIALLEGKQRRKVVERVRRYIGKNYSDEAIMETCRIRPDLLRNIKAEILNMDTSIFEHMSSGGVYSDYLMKSHQMVKRLHSVQKRFTGRGQWTALVAAIKQEKDIYDSCIKHGQDFGFIEKKAQSLEVSGEFTFGHLTEKEIKAEIESEIKALNILAEGRTINMRPELLDVAGEDVTSFVPENVVNIPKEARLSGKVKVKRKVSLRKNV